MALLKIKHIEFYDNIIMNKEHYKHFIKKYIHITVILDCGVSIWI